MFKKLFDELENQCFELDKKIQMALAGDSEENDEKFQAFRAAQLQFTRTAQQFNEKGNYLQELLNLQSLHPNVYNACLLYTTTGGDRKTPWKCKGGGNNNVFVLSSITAVQFSNSIAHVSNPS